MPSSQNLKGTSKYQRILGSILFFSLLINVGMPSLLVAEIAHISLRLFNTFLRLFVFGPVNLSYSISLTLEYY